MNALVLPYPRKIASTWHEKFHACLFFGALVIGLASALAIVLHAGNPQLAALGATAFALLLVVVS